MNHSDQIKLILNTEKHDQDFHISLKTDVEVSLNIN